MTHIFTLITVCVIYLLSSLDDVITDPFLTLLLKRPINVEFRAPRP